MITIFEIVTLPSVLNQTSADFSLLVVIDSDMPPSCLDRLTALTLGRTNVRLVRLDVKEILNPQIGGFSYVWEACQSAILENSLIESEQDYIITSVLDADDAWHMQTVQFVRANMERMVPDIQQSESGKNTWCRHSGGFVATFPKGLGWLMQSNQYYNITFSFHSMSVFVLSRFSSNISACSSRHAKWQSYAEVVDFRVGIIEDTPPMWVYSRHDEAVLSWQLDEKFLLMTQPMKHQFKQTFGIDIDRYDEWLFC